MDGTEGLVRGQVCVDTGTPISIPVGPETLGRIINVIGEPIDERGPVNAKEYVTSIWCMYIIFKTRVQLYMTALRTEMVDVMTLFGTGRWKYMIPNANTD